MRSRKLSRPFLGAAVAVMLVGCGSTVQYVGGGAPGQSGESTLNLGTGTTPGSTPTGSVPTGSRSTGTGALQGPGGGSLPPIGAASTPPAGRSPGSSPTHAVNGIPQGVGITSKTISVGIWYETNGDALNAAFGATGLSTGNEQADAKAVVEDINAHGGIAGRKVVPVYYALNAQTTDSYASIDQQACDRFTQDNHVFAVMGKGLTDNFMACIARAGVMDMNSATITYPDRVLMNQYPLYFDAGTLTNDRIFVQQVRSLKQQGYFSGWDASLGAPSKTSRTKIGVLSIGIPEWNRPLHSAFLPALHAAGYTVSPQDIFQIANPASTSQEGNVLSAIAAAELRFRQDGVNHVILLDSNGDLLLFFSRDAGSQHYYPRFGVSTASAPETLEAAGDVSPQALNGTMGFSWDAGLDLPPSQAAHYQSAAGKACLKMVDKRTGQNLEKLGPNAEGIAIGHCDELYLLRDGINHAGASITAASVEAAIQSLHNSFPSAGFLQEYFGPGRHDGVELGWNEAWNSGCTCMKFTSGPFRIP